MHLSDGFLPARVCLTGYGITGLLTWYCLYQVKRQGDITTQIPKASLLTAAFFVASLIHIPLPPTTVHPILNGLLGALLGYYSFLAILIGLGFQAVMFHHGGLSTLGLNAIIMGVPALIAHFLFRLRYRLKWKNKWVTSSFGFLAGLVGVGMSVLIFFGLLVYNIAPELDLAIERASLIQTVVLANVPLMFLEGGLTAMIISYLEAVKPDILGTDEV